MVLLHVFAQILISFEEWEYTDFVRHWCKYLKRMWENRIKCIALFEEVQACFETICE